MLLWYRTYLWGSRADNKARPEVKVSCHNVDLDEKLPVKMCTGKSNHLGWRCWSMLIAVIASRLLKHTVCIV